MPIYNFNIKIECGARTETKVHLHATTVNDKEMKFSDLADDVVTTTNTAFARRLQKLILSWLNILPKKYLERNK